MVLEGVLEGPSCWEQHSGLVEGGESPLDQAVHGEWGGVGVCAVQDDPEVAVDCNCVCPRKDEVDPGLECDQVRR